MGSRLIGGGARAAVDHMVRGGRRRIAFLGAADLPEIAMRLAGYRTALDRGGDLKIVTTNNSDALWTGATAYLQGAQDRERDS